MAWEEWVRSKEAVAEGHTPMRLNEAGSQGAAAADLVVHQDDLGAVGHEAFVLHGELK
ncbi:hypothetical protein LEL86_00925 [Streptomyces sp. WA6-1-16]|uniref:hypothetical protein n=1 Tax=Streptomyces sp. WA6-1-16 TaxID=2879427 RepID=UPI001CE240D5|nr:hypothetical protein [Streptomyces sp. WA6-1-16]UCA47947.1 hypothetical protein LEL86_00925 [Streptomyces sp. WA6-1-16]